MNLAEAQALFGELAASTTGVDVEIGTRGRGRRAYAYLKLSSPTNAKKYAVVSTPGVGSFELEVTGGFYTGRADDMATDDESVRGYVEQYLRAAIHYLDGRWSEDRSKLLRRPIVIVHTNDGDLTLHR